MKGKAKKKGESERRKIKEIESKRQRGSNEICLILSRSPLVWSIMQREGLASLKIYEAVFPTLLYLFLERDTYSRHSSPIEFYLMENMCTLNLIEWSFSLIKSMTKFHYYMDYVLYLKGVTRFLASGFFHQTTPFVWAFDPRVKEFLHMTSYSRRYSTLKSIFLWSAVSMTPLTKVALSMTPLTLAGLCQ
jgi:hypothetical protein